MNIWLTVKELSAELQYSEQYVRYLIAGRSRKYGDRTRKESPKINEKYIRKINNGRRVKYLIHSSILETLK